MIKFNDFSSEYFDIRAEIDAAISRVLDSGMLILGDEVRRFEDGFASYAGARHGVGLNSGTDALYLAVKALGIGPGDEVITVSHTMIATVDAITRNGARAVMVDIDPETYNIDLELLRGAITKKTKAIVPVDLYGNPVDIRAIKEIADEKELYVIEDASQAAGSEFRGKKTGSLADITAFSLYPTKNLGAYGDAGIILTNDVTMAEKIRMLRNYGQKERYNHQFQGINSRMDELQASILQVKLKHLDTWNERRRKIASLYREQLDDTKVIVPAESELGKHVYHLFVVRSNKRDHLLQELKKQGVSALVHYPVPVHLQRSYIDMGYSQTLPITEKIVKEIISLPIHPYLENDQIEFVSNTVNRVL